MSDASYVLTDNQLHRYLAEAFRTGMDSEKADHCTRSEEAYARSEHHAREFVRPRVEMGLIAAHLRNSGGQTDLVLGIFKDFSVTEGGDCTCGDQWRLGQCAECRHRHGAVEAIFDLLAALRTPLDPEPTTDSAS